MEALGYLSINPLGCWVLLNLLKSYESYLIIVGDIKNRNWKVNNLPSLHINTIDAAVNRPMIAELLNIVGLTIPRSIVNKHAKSIAKDRDGNRIIGK